MYDITGRLDDIQTLITQLDGTATKQGRLLEAVYVEIAKAYKAGKQEISDEMAQERSNRAWEYQSTLGGTM